MTCLEPRVYVLLFGFVASLLASCGAADPNAKFAVENGDARAKGSRLSVVHASSERLDWVGSGCRRVERRPGFLGLSSSSLIDRMGPVEADTYFVLGKDWNEFRIGLLNLYDRPEHAQLRVREMIWHARGCRLAAWLVEDRGIWTSVQTLKWNENTSF